MKNYVQKGNTVTTAAPYAVSAGGGALVGSMFGVAVDDAANGADVELVTEGVFDISKTAGQAVTVGALIYWDNGNKLATTTATSNKLIGVATAAAAAGDSTVRVRLNGAFTS